MTVTIYGQPKALKRHRVSGGRMYDPSKRDKEIFLLEAMNSRPPKLLEGAVSLSLVFYMGRPKSHYVNNKRENDLRESAPICHTSTPDVDNLAKFVFDSLNGVYWKDDKQIFHVDALKIYSTEPRTVINFSEIETP